MELDINVREKDTIVELICNLDDMTAEAMGFAMEELWSAGAMDVFTQSIQMKKQRPGTLLTVLCHEDKKDQMVELLFKHTTTLGVRERVCERYTLARKFSEVKTPFGSVGKKTSYGYGVCRAKYEYDDLVKLAKAYGMTLAQLQNVVRQFDELGAGRGAEDED